MEVDSQTSPYPQAQVRGERDTVFYPPMLLVAYLRSSSPANVKLICRFILLFNGSLFD
jgi:hypothetical protein